MTITTEKLAESVESALAGEDFTPYQLAGAASKVVGKYVREQMLYQYVAKGFIPSQAGSRPTKQGPRDVKVILRADAVAWLMKYATKQLAAS